MFAKKILILLCICFSVSFTLFSQSGGVYDQHEAFATVFYPAFGDEVRTAAGTPGPKYWQNETDYTIKATLDDVKQQVSGEEQITYKNNSPEPLPFLWLQMDQNIYNSDSRGELTTPVGGGRYANRGFEGGYTIKSLTVIYQGREQKIHYIISDTRMQIFLPEALKPHGDSLKINIVYDFNIPERGTDRMGRVETENGWIYTIAQWYPRMCVFDNVLGWNTLPYIGAGEFYLDYGNYDFSITTAGDQLVVASGELMNPSEVLTTDQIKLLDLARNSDKTVMIRTEDEVNKKIGRLKKDKLVWHFKCDHTRDVAFASSRAYIWDAARINLPEGKKSLAMSVYPVESVGDGAWNRATEYLKKSIEYFSAQWYVYPYPVAINEAGIAGGMEYPGIVFDAITDKGKDLYWVTAHEIGHDWFPMIVGSDERRYAFMDEGFNTFIDIYADDAFNKGEYAPKRDPEYAPGGGNPVAEIVPWLQDSMAPVMMTRADGVPEKYRHPMEYFKPALGLVLLREQILGKERFDYAFHQYIREWAYRHPTPVDFFRTMDNQAGEDLSWFWREWFYHNWSLDLAVESVSYKDNDPKKGVEITILNLDKMAMPVTVELEWKDGQRQRINLPVETWLQSGTHVLHLPGGQALASVTLDPDQVLPDANRKNNVWKNGDIR